MIRLRLLQVAALLLLLLQISSVEGLINMTACQKNWACWVSEECIQGKIYKREENIETFRINKNENDEMLAKVNPSCTKYFIVEPGIDHFVFEFMHSGLDKDKYAIIGFSSHTVGQTFTCSKQNVMAGESGAKFDVISEASAEQQNFFCRFKVVQKIRDQTRTFWAVFIKAFKPYQVSIKHEDKSVPTIKMDDYNDNYFKTKIPCDPNIFLPPGADKEEYRVTANHGVFTGRYTCPDNYRMSYKFKADMGKVPDQGFKTTKAIEMECFLGEVKIGDEKIGSAKCSRPRSSLCADVFCTNCTRANNLTSKPEHENGDKRTIQCTNYMILNGNRGTNQLVSCSDDSEPDKQIWTIKGSKEPIKIETVSCVETLPCNELAPFGEAACDTCGTANFNKGRLTCANGGKLKYFDQNIQYPVTAKCLDNGKWELEYAGKSISAGRNESKTMKIGCVGPKPKDTTEKKAAAQAGSSMLIVGCSMGVLILLLLILLLIYWLCCRKKSEKPKEESRKETTPTPTRTETNSSAVEVELPTAPPIQPASNESDGPGYSGKRVQFINVSKEHLREIEPEIPQEFSARDKTDSTRSKASQMSQVGGTTDGGITFTGPRATEKTNEVSRTMVKDDLSRSDASNGGTDQSQTGGGGNTPTIGAAAAKKKMEKEKGGGSRVAFRERVSYETDTKTRDQSSMAGMVTAPEQLTQQTQPEGSTVEGKKKDDPSRLTAEKARKTFGKEQTRTTQNTKGTNDDANTSQQQDSVVAKRSASRVSDVSRTG